MLIKGQLFSSDFMVGVSIFLITFTILFIHFSNLNVQILDVDRKNNLADVVFSVSDIWSHDGVPEFWNENDFVSIGLQNNNRINSTKMNSLNDIGYNNFRSINSVYPYETYMRVYNQTNSTQFEFGTQPLNALDITKVNRFGILNGSIVTIEVLVWQ